MAPDDQAHEKCYVFTPDDSRPNKRRRLEPTGLHRSWPIRREAYSEAWTAQKRRIDARLKDINAATIRDISTFLDEAETAHSSDGKIPAGIVLSGPDATAYGSITAQLRANAVRHGRRVFASLSARSGTNLKAMLKALIQSATARTDGARGEAANEDEDEEEDEELTRTSRAGGAKLLNYDLQILSDFVQDRKVSQVIVSFDNTEALDSKLLSELIELLGCWRGRIPLVCLFGVATSVDFLQQQLTRGAVQCLAGQLFDVAPSGDVIEQVFDAIVTADVPLWIGPGLAGAALDRQRDYIQSIESLVDAAQYAYLSCYYANALVIFSIPGIAIEDIPPDHFAALRTLDWFRQEVEQQTNDGHLSEARDLLTSDRALYDLTQEKLVQSQDRMEGIMVAIGVIQCIQRCLVGTLAASRPSDLYIQAMSGRLQGSALLRNMLLSIRKASSEQTSAVLTGIIALDVDIPEVVSRTALTSLQELKALVLEHADTGAAPLRSEDNVTHSTLRTTVVAQKVELSKHRSALSQHDAAYTALLRRFTDALDAFFADALVDPRSLPLHEIWLYDARSPYREAFTPRPRHAVERALAAPHDYLDCDCCGDNGDGDGSASLSSSQPATAILYQLYLESGSLINASDLWQAFRAVVGEEKPEEAVVAQFQRSLAELKYLGFVKSTRKRVDHIAKVAWAGL